MGQATSGSHVFSYVGINRQKCNIESEMNVFHNLNIPTTPTHNAFDIMGVLRLYKGKFCTHLIVSTKEKYIICLFVYLLSCMISPSMLWCQERKPWLNDSLTNSHVIIAFDAALPSAYNTIPNHSPAFNRQIRRALEYVGIHQGDYYSFVNFVLGDASLDLNAFAQTSIMGGTDMAWQTFTDYEELFSHGSWNFIFLGRSRVQGRPFSILTGAKPYSLRALHGKNDTRYSNKTYLLMVTDDQYNGNNDINTEFRQLGPEMSRHQPAFLEFCRQVSSKYQFNFKKEFIIDAYLSAPYKVIVFEVTPMSSFSLNSVVDYPAMLGLKRTRAGYKLHFAYKCLDKAYKMQKLQISYIKRNGDLFSENYYGSSGTVDVIMRDIPADSVDVTLKGWLQYDDGVYGGVVESPLDENFERLSYTTTLPLGKEEKVLGIIPLPDILWWFFPNDLSKAVLIWDVIVALIIIITIIVFAIKAFDRWTKYEPKNDQIRITKI